jgi:hypothetical protein
MEWIGYTNLYRKDKVDVFLEDEKKGKAWLRKNNKNAY